MAIVLKVEGTLIAQARFSTYGCPVAVSCGQFVCEKIERDTVHAAASIDEAEIIANLGQMPLGRGHCPGLAVGALRDALLKIGQSFGDDELKGDH